MPGGACNPPPVFFWLTHDRRDADFRPSAQTVVGLSAFGIDADLTGAQELLQIGVADLGKVHAEPAVEAHVHLAVTDPDRFDFAGYGHASAQRDTQSPTKTAKRLRTTEATT